MILVHIKVKENYSDSFGGMEIIGRLNLSKNPVLVCPPDDASYIYATTSISSLPNIHILQKLYSMF